MSVTVTRTAGSTIPGSRWTNFSPSFLQNRDSYLATCNLRAGDAANTAISSNFGFSIPLNATITGISGAAYWWGSNTGSYIYLSLQGSTIAYDTGAVSGRWVSDGAYRTLCTPAQANDPGYLSLGVDVGRTTGAAVNVHIDQITVSITYEPYVAPAPPPPPAPNGTTVPTNVVNVTFSGATSTTVSLAGNVGGDGGSAISAVGFCVAKFPNSGASTVGGAGGVGEFSFTQTGLEPSTLYYVRAYATNANGTAYSPNGTFSTTPRKAGDGGTGFVSGMSGQMVGYAGGGGGGMFGVGSGGGARHGGGAGRSPYEGWGNPGIINTGGGGGGTGAQYAGGAGGSGVVIIRYKTADAVATSPSLSTSIFRPSLAYRAGRLFAPYSKGEDAMILTITGNTLANPTIVTTSAAHGIPAATAQVVVIAGSVGSVPLINGSYVATRVSDTTFSIPVNVTTAGTAGLVLYNHSVGWALTAGGYNDIGWITQSPTTFHTGSMKKDFRYVSVSHDVLPDGATVRPMSWLIDGVYGTANGQAYSPQETRFPIDQQGYSIETTMGMTPDYTKAISPLVHGINVIWNFVKNKKHTYSLDCRSGANAGKWGGDPETALRFLYATANERATFEDRFAGVYQGAIETVEFTPAPTSSSEGPSGLAKIVVREQS